MVKLRHLCLGTKVGSPSPRPDIAQTARVGFSLYFRNLCVRTRRGKGPVELLRQAQFATLDLMRRAQDMHWALSDLILPN